MTDETQRPGLQAVEMKRKLSVRRKRSRDLMQELRHRIPDLFDRSDGAYDRVAEDLSVPQADVLAETLLDTRRQLKRAVSMGMVVPIRRSA